MKTSELTGIALDWAVATAEGATNLRYDTVSTWWMTLNGEAVALRRGWAQAYLPSTDWAIAGPIIERENISIIRLEDYCVPDEKGYWQGVYEPLWAAVAGEKHWLTSRYGDESRESYEVDPEVLGSTPLEAAMRAYVWRKLGAEVEVPGELK